MHKVKRLGEPNSLKLNATKWTDGLLEQIPKYEKFSDIPDRFVKKYDQPDIREALDRMYNGFCCYCESPIGTQVTERIEHLKPKSKFPEQCFSWSNLNYSCDVCNGKSYKWDQWDYVNPILDPTVDEIDRYLELDLDTAEITAKNNNPRANTTITHVGLNREKLVTRRKEIISGLKKLLVWAVKHNDLKYFKELVIDYKSTNGYPFTCETFLNEVYKNE